MYYITVLKGWHNRQYAICDRLVRSMYLNVKAAIFYAMKALFEEAGDFQLFGEFRSQYHQGFLWRP
jgi:hypothetical protein